jgi:UDP-N-acetylglucosamine--N-acetylmuramyl-(pentapeptide) pyrophosphoryl-undecaprenol N-acetylglucosamine transferase
MMKVVIAAAGTGGHINPGIAIANKIMEKEPDSKIIFIGTPRGLENDLVPRAGYELKTIDAYGINRKINLDNIKRLYKTTKSVGEAKKILKEFKPDVVIGTGGYICVSVGIAANRLKIPIVLHESNAFPGVAIKLLSKKAKAVLLGFEDAKTRLPKAKNVVVTGTPTKIKSSKLTDEEKANLRSALMLKNELPLVLVFGGSQGARSINNAIIGIIENKLNKNYQIIWAAGKGNFENIKQQLAEKNMDIDNIENAKIMPYIYNMQEVMETSDLVVSRSGAMTITEISNLAKPAIFIPFPFATENHQEYNARVLEKVGAAKIILDKNLNYKNLNDTIELMVENKEQLKEMGKKAGKIANTNVEENIYNEIRNILSKN